MSSNTPEECQMRNTQLFKCIEMHEKKKTGTNTWSANWQHGYLRSASWIVDGPRNENPPLPVDDNGSVVISDRSRDRRRSPREQQYKHHHYHALGSAQGLHVNSWTGAHDPLWLCITKATLSCLRVDLHWTSHHQNRGRRKRNILTGVFGTTFSLFYWALRIVFFSFIETKSGSRGRTISRVLQLLYKLLKNETRGTQIFGSHINLDDTALGFFFFSFPVIVNLF